METGAGGLVHSTDNVSKETLTDQNLWLSEEAATWSIFVLFTCMRLCECKVAGAARQGLWIPWSWSYRYL